MRSILYRLIKANGDDDTLGMRLFYIFMMLGVVYLCGHMIYYFMSHNYHQFGY